MTTWIRQLWHDLHPDAWCESLADIDFSQLAGRGKRLLLLDADGTIVSLGSNKVSPQYQAALQVAARCGIQDIAILSNANPKNRCNNDRLTTVQRTIGARFFMAVSGARRKPSPVPFLEAVERLGGKPEETVMVGDRLVDILGAKRAGIYAIKVSPIGPDFWTVWPERWLEKFLTPILKKRST